ncbi:unnamed protein product [Linum trigynum]|uniref:Uncharacterized protein n=1 Tax=Linum trigynum TaxID=586398 RepID=A0AAV2CR63_9ROSI
MISRKSRTDGMWLGQEIINIRRLNLPSSGGRRQGDGDNGIGRKMGREREREREWGCKQMVDFPKSSWRETEKV